MALTLTSRFSVRKIVSPCRIPSAARNAYHTSASTRSEDGLQSTPVRVGDPDEDKSPSVDASKVPLPEDLRELNTRFNEIFKIAGPDEDRGVERLERLTRQQMKRVPRYQGDFSTLEENHILFGRMGRPDSPVLVESIFPTRTVGCMGSSLTKHHDVLWHVVKREKPCMCIECGQVFQLVTPPGEHIEPFHHNEGYH